MQNLLPEFSRPPPSRTVPAAAIVEKDLQRNPSKVTLTRQRETAQQIAYLTHRPPERHVYLNGWPLDAPHLRHTVLFEGQYPHGTDEPSVLTDSVHMLTDGDAEGHPLLTDAAKSVGGYRTHPAPSRLTVCSDPPCVRVSV